MPPVLETNINVLSEVFGSIANNREHNREVVGEPNQMDVADVADVAAAFTRAGSVEAMDRQFMEQLRAGLRVPDFHLGVPQGESVDPHIDDPFGLSRRLMREPTGRTYVPPPVTTHTPEELGLLVTSTNPAEGATFQTTNLVGDLNDVVYRSRANGALTTMPDDVHDYRTVGVITAIDRTVTADGFHNIYTVRISDRSVSVASFAPPATGLYGDPRGDLTWTTTTSNTNDTIDPASSLRRITAILPDLEAMVADWKKKKEEEQRTVSSAQPKETVREA